MHVQVASSFAKSSHQFLCFLPCWVLKMRKPAVHRFLDKAIRHHLPLVFYPTKSRYIPLNPTSLRKWKSNFFGTKSLSWHPAPRKGTSLPDLMKRGRCTAKSLCDLARLFPGTRFSFSHGLPQGAPFGRGVGKVPLTLYKKRLVLRSQKLVQFSKVVSLLSLPTASQKQRGCPKAARLPKNSEAAACAQVVGLWWEWRCPAF